MNIVKILIENSKKFPDKIAIAEKKKRCNFKQLEEEALKLASFLKEKGIKKGDCVLVLQNMSVELYSVLIALWSIGAAALVFDPSAGREHIKRCCSMIRPKAFIGSNKAHLLSIFYKEIRNIPIKISTENNIILETIKSSQNYNCSEIEELKEDDAALVTFTSGSTGMAKAAVRTHEFLLQQYKILDKNMKYDKSQIDLATLPIFTIANLASGVVTVIPDTNLRNVSNIKSKKVAEQIIKENVSRISASPSFISCVTAYCEKNKIILPSLKYIYTGGGPVFPRLMNRISKIFPNAKLIMVYGSTEAEPIAEIDWEGVSESDIEKMGNGSGLLAGKPISDIELRIIKEQWGSPLKQISKHEFERISCSMNETGEIVVSGCHVLKGYYNGIGDEDNKFDTEGKRWHRTGDMGYIDAEGRVWLMGRASAIVKDNKGIIYPFSVECAVNTYFDLERSALVKSVNGRIVIIEKNKKIISEEILKKLSWAEIDEVYEIKKIPTDKRHNAKIDYTVLLKMIKRKYN